MENIVNLEKKTLEDLRFIAKVMGVKNISKYRKDELISLLTELGGKQGDGKGDIGEKTDSKDTEEAREDGKKEDQSSLKSPLSY